MMFSDSILVVAHPDDDILWLSSVLEQVGAIVFCFNDYPGDPGIGVARRRTIAEYPLSGVRTLAIEEPRSFNKADWKQPGATDYGIELVKSAAADKRYRRAYKTVFAALADILKGKKNVFTHNPWGEYGHEDHILVYRAIRKLQPEHGYNIWFSNYCSNRSVALMDRYIRGFHSDYQRLPANVTLARDIADIYRRNDCWTWYEDYEWFESEYLMKQAPSSRADGMPDYGHIFPINYLKVDIGDNSQVSARHPERMFRRIKRKIRGIL